MKKTLMAMMALMVTLMVLTLTGCGDGSDGGDAAGGTAGVPAESFVGADWYRPIEGCGENLCFAEDETFHYSEDCGSPVGDADLYEAYTYDEATGVITVTSPYGEDDMTIKMVSCEGDKLVLDFDGEQRVFDKGEE